MDYRQVEGHHNLVRDMDTGAILNMDQSAYQAALMRHHNAEKQKNQLEENTNDINSIKEEVSEIKGMMQQLLHKEITHGR